MTKPVAIELRCHATALIAQDLENESSFILMIETIFCPFKKKACLVYRVGYDRVRVWLKVKGHALNVKSHESYKVMSPRLIKVTTS